MRKKRILYTSLSIAAVLTLSGCGSSDYYKEAVNEKVANTFTDSKVIGLPYTCSSDTKIAITDAEGQFKCKEGDTVTFSVGSVILGSWKVDTSGKDVTPYTLSPEDGTVMINIAQLVQSLDEDNNPENNIVIDSTKLEKFNGKNIPIDASNFDILAGAVIPLKDAKDAEKHLISSNPDIPDIVPPLITINGDLKVEIKQGLLYVDAGAVAYDVYDEKNVTISTTDNVNTNIPGKYSVIYTAVDEAGNKAKAERTVVVLEDLPPVLTILGNNPFDIKQNSIPQYIDPGATAMDEEDGNLTADIITEGVDEVDPSVVKDYNVTYSVSDSFGHKVMKIRKVIVSPNIPVITILGDNPTTIRVDDVYIDAGATAEDVEDGNLTADIITDESALDVSKIGKYPVIYSVTDSDGYKATATRTVIVQADLPPTVELKGPNPYSVENNLTEYVDPGAEAKDDGTIVSLTMKSDVNISKGGTYSVIWTAEDDKGQKASATRTVHVIDVTPPVISLIGSNPLIQSYGNYVEPGAEAMDETDGNLTKNIKIDPLLDQDSGNMKEDTNYTVTYSVKDNSGNLATKTREVTIKACQNVNPITGECEDGPL